MFLCTRSFRWTWIRLGLLGFAAQFSLLVVSSISIAGAPDVDDNGYVDPKDYRYFAMCLSLSGPGVQAPFSECRTDFDADGDEDVDLSDFAAFQRARGHLPFPLRDTFGNVIQVESTVPYSGQQTCGANSCHDIARITNGIKFQEGRTDPAGNIIMREDYYGDGRWWIRGAGRYGRAVPIGSERILAPKQGAHESDMDLTTFGWVGECGACHTGGGPGEFDRDGVRLYDPPTGRFGYEVLGKTAEDVALDGDYTVLNTTTGDLSLAPWDLTGLSEPDCLYCHTPDPRWKDSPFDRLNWRRATLAAKTNLVDSSGNSVPAYAAAGPAGQGWFSTLQIQNSVAKVLQLDYSVGVNLGMLALAPDGVLNLVAQSVDRPPRDVVCWGCHNSAQSRRGDPWFDERIVHYARWNKLTDDDPSNDVPMHKSRGCNYCHPGNLDHNFAKGNNPNNVFRDELDWVNFRSCRDCHMPLLSNGEPNPRKHPDAPDVPGNTIIHLIGDPISGRGPFDIVSCQGCHIPYPLSSPAISAVSDRATTGASIAYSTDVFYSADPLNPSDPDRSRWYASLGPKVDSDGVTRLFPERQTQSCLWGDWDQNGTPDDWSDDVVAPIALWRVRQITGGNPLPGVTDDNGDGKPEVNRDEEVLAYIQALKGVDSYGRQVAANPVYLKGLRVWYEDPQALGGVSSFDPAEFGTKVEFGSKGALSHGVLPKEYALGYNATNPELGCRDCHRPDTLDSPVFDRMVLMDPWDKDGRPVYKTVRELTGMNPP